MTSKEQALLTVMHQIFGQKPFDMADIYGKIDRCPEFVTAVEAVIPSCTRKTRYKHPLPRERLRTKVVRRFFMAWAKEHFTTNEMGWWCLKVPSPHGPLALGQR